MTPPAATAGGDLCGASAGVAVAIPAHNESGRIGAVVVGVRRHIERVIVIDDGSGDATAEEAALAGADVWRHEHNRGKGAALLTGIGALNAENPPPRAVIMMDGDGQHDPEDLPNFLDAWKCGARCIVGNRMTQASAMPWLRRWTNRVMSEALSRRCGQYIPDSQCGYRLVDAGLAAGILRRSRCRHYDFVSELLLIAAAEHIEIRSVAVRCVYDGQPSGIQPARDTLRFLRLMCRG